MTLPLFRSIIRENHPSSLVSPYVFRQPFDLINIENIANYYFSLSEDDMFKIDELPIIRPIADISWMEFHLDNIKDFDFNRTSPMPSLLAGMPIFQRFGGEDTRMTIESVGCLMRYTPTVPSDLVYGKDNLHLPKESASTLDVYLYQSYKFGNRKRIIPSGGHTELRYILDSEGGLVLLDIGQFGEQERNVFDLDSGEKPKAIFYTESTDYRPMALLEEGNIDKLRFVMSLVDFSKPFLLANCFMASKNVILIDDNTRKKIRRKVKHIGKQNKRNPTRPRKDKIIAIKPLRNKLRVKGQGGATKPTGKRKKRLKCHFRTYGKEGGGLFGKYYGTFLIMGYGYDKGQNQEYIIDLV